MVHRLVDEYGDRIKFEFHHFPLPNHKYAIPGAEAVEAAGEQGKFWDMVDRLYSNGGNINDQIIYDTARNLGLDMNRYQDSVNGHLHLNLIRSDLEEGKKKNINGTPHFVIGHSEINGLPKWEQLDSIVQQELAKVN